MGIETILALVGTIGGMIIPPVYDFIKKKFLPVASDSPEATMSALSMSKPDILPGYVKALSDYFDAQTRYFNRDIAGQPSVWVINLRAAIRPVAVLVAFGILTGALIFRLDLDSGTRAGLLVIIGNWLGSRITQ